MKQILVISIFALLATTSKSQVQIDSLNKINDQVIQLNEKVQQIEKNAQKISYKLNKSSKESEKQITAIYSEIDSLREAIGRLDAKIENISVELNKTKDEMSSFQGFVSDRFLQSRKNSRFNIILTASTLLFLLIVIGTILFLYTKKTWHELVELKREVDFEIKTTEKETLRELRAIQQEIKKIKSPDFLKQIQDEIEDINKKLSSK